MKSPIVINDKERRVLLRVLGKYQDLLESSMGALVVPGTQKARSKIDQLILQENHRDWMAAETMVLMLEGRTRVKPFQARETGCV